MHSSHQKPDRQDSSEESHTISLTAQLVGHGHQHKKGLALAVWVSTCYWYCLKFLKVLWKLAAGQRRERKIQISISMESRASCELSHSTNIQWISMRNSPLQDVLWSESAFIWKPGEKMARRKGGFGVSGTIDFPLLFWNCFHPIIRPSPRLGTNIAPHLRTEEQMWEKKQ